MISIDPTKISGFRDAMGSQGKQKATVESYGRDMANFLQFIESANIHSGDIGLETLEEFKNWMLTRGSKPSSIRRAVIAIRMFFRWLEEIGELHGNPFDDAPVPAHEQHAARLITAEKIEFMLTLARSSDSALKASRDAVLLLLLSREGLKSSEIVTLCWSHFFAAGESGRLTISGDRARTIGLEVETTLALKTYRDVLQNDPRTRINFNQSAPIFVSFKGADARAVHSGITRHGLKFAIYELGSAAEVPQLNAEQLRHMAMSHKLGLGYTPDMVMNHLGLRRVGNIGKHLGSP
jgi:integrase/recombinase XerD